MAASLVALFRSTPPVAMAAMPMNTFKVIFAMSFMMVVGCSPAVSLCCWASFLSYFVGFGEPNSLSIRSEMVWPRKLPAFMPALAAALTTATVFSGRVLVIFSSSFMMLLFDVMLSVG